METQSDPEYDDISMAKLESSSEASETENEDKEHVSPNNEISLSPATKNAVELAKAAYDHTETEQSKKKDPSSKNGIPEDSISDTNEVLDCTDKSRNPDVETISDNGEQHCESVAPKSTSDHISNSNVENQTSVVKQTKADQGRKTRSRTTTEKTV